VLVPRAGPRETRVGDSDDTASEETLDPVDPAEPSVSANAAGIEAIPAPTPNANASAPTRPT
jgi:hypothetical protein